MESETVPKDYSAQLCNYEVRVCSTTIKWPAYHLALHVIREHPTELWEEGYPSTEPFASQTAYLNRVGRMCKIVEELKTFQTKCADVKPKLLQPVTQERTEVHEIYKEGTELLNRAIQLGEEQTTLDHTLPTEPDLLGSKYWEVSRFRYSLQAIQDAARQFPEKWEVSISQNTVDFEPYSGKILEQLIRRELQDLQRATGNIQNTDQQPDNSTSPASVINDQIQDVLNHAAAVPSTLDQRQHQQVTELVQRIDFVTQYAEQHKNPRTVELYKTANSLRNLLLNTKIPTQAPNPEPRPYHLRVKGPSLTLPVFDGNILSYPVWRDDMHAYLASVGGREDDPQLGLVIRQGLPKVAQDHLNAEISPGSVICFPELLELMDKIFLKSGPLIREARKQIDQLPTCTGPHALMELTYISKWLKLFMRQCQRAKIFTSIFTPELYTQVQRRVPVHLQKPFDTLWGNTVEDPRGHGWEAIVEFLRDETSYVENLPDYDLTLVERIEATQRKPNPKTPANASGVTVNLTTTSASIRCYLCSNPHAWIRCDLLRGGPSLRVMNLLKERDICLRCVRPNHLCKRGCNGKYTPVSGKEMSTDCKFCSSQHNSKICICRLETPRINVNSVHTRPHSTGGGSVNPFSVLGQTKLLSETITVVSDAGVKVNLAILYDTGCSDTLCQSNTVEPLIEKFCYGPKVQVTGFNNQGTYLNKPKSLLLSFKAPQGHFRLSALAMDHLNEVKADKVNVPMQWQRYFMVETFGSQSSVTTLLLGCDQANFHPEAVQTLDTGDGCVQLWKSRFSGEYLISGKSAKCIEVYENSNPMINACSVETSCKIVLLGEDEQHTIDQELLDEMDGNGLIRQTDRHFEGVGGGPT